MNDIPQPTPEDELPKPAEEQPVTPSGASGEPPTEPEIPPPPSQENELPTGAMQVDTPHEDSRLRRFARRALRWALTALLVFALGVAALYFLRLRPLEAEMSAFQGQATETAGLYHTAQQDLMAAQERVKMLEGQMQQDAEERDLAIARYNLQKIYTDVAVARLAMASRDGAMAKSALEQARTDLTAFQPAVPAEDAALGEALKGRLDLVLNGLNRDPRTALADLDIFANDLQELEKKLFD